MLGREGEGGGRQARAQIIMQNTVQYSQEMCLNSHPYGVAGEIKMATMVVNFNDYGKLIIAHQL